MKNLKLSKKTIVQMVLSILVILFLMWYFTRGVVTSAAKKDIFSMEPHRIIMES